jgi:two-component system, cell cycle response regulator
MSELRVLLVEDDEDDCVLTRDLLGEGFGSAFEMTWAMTAAAGLEELTNGTYDVALVDYNLGAATGVELLRTAVAQGCRIPVIMLTGQADRATDLKAMHAGAADYLVKSRVTSDMLERAIRYARERHRLLEQISALSLTDELTGLTNRRGFLTMAEQRLQLLVRRGCSCLMLFADVDGLKEVNDHGGHEAGDRLLIAAATALRDAFRSTDLIARLGGDEFVVLAEFVDDGDMPLLLGRVEQKIDEHNRHRAEGTTELSISIGALSFTTGPTLNLQELIAEADSRMLLNKALRYERMSLVSAAAAAGHC